MIVTDLKLANLRCIKTAAFSFRPGFNLVVGVNGVGKTTVLDALRVCLSHVLVAGGVERGGTLSFKARDVRQGASLLDIDLSVEMAGHTFRYNRKQWNERIAADSSENVEQQRREILDSDRLQTRAGRLLRKLDEAMGVSNKDGILPSKGDLKQAVAGSRVAPNCIFFSVSRSVIQHTKTSTSKGAGGRAVAYAQALMPRSWNISELADWMRAQQSLGSESRLAKRHVKVLQNAASRFLPRYKNLRPDRDHTRMLIDCGEMKLDVEQLSDGERGILGLVLDLARRLSQANPSLADPLRQGEAIVLIDEIDLHLHPAWQRQIVANLVEVFPRCQFIATTHSPQVIGEVRHDQIQIITDGQVYSPTHSFGVDSSRVLDEVMGAPSRDPVVSQLLSHVSRAIGMQQVKLARDLLKKAAERLELGENDPDITRLMTLIDFMEGNE